MVGVVTRAETGRWGRGARPVAGECSFSGLSRGESASRVPNDARRRMVRSAGSCNAAGLRRGCLSHGCSPHLQARRAQRPELLHRLGPHPQPAARFRKWGACRQIVGLLRGTARNTLCHVRDAESRPSCARPSCSGARESAADSSWPCGLDQRTGPAQLAASAGGRHADASRDSRRARGVTERRGGRASSLLHALESKLSWGGGM